MRNIEKNLYDSLYKALTIENETGYCYPDSDDIGEVIDIVCDHYGISDGNNFNFDKVAKVMMNYLRTNHHPHTKIIITSTECEMVEGLKSVVNNEFKKSDVEYLSGLFNMFLNHQSDSCSLEASDAEKTDLEWRKFISELNNK